MTRGSTQGWDVLLLKQETLYGGHKTGGLSNVDQRLSERARNFSPELGGEWLR